MSTITGEITEDKTVEICMAACIVACFIVCYDIGSLAVCAQRTWKQRDSDYPDGVCNRGRGRPGTGPYDRHILLSPERLLCTGPNSDIA